MRLMRFIRAKKPVWAKWLARSATPASRRAGESKPTGDTTRWRQGGVRSGEFLRWKQQNIARPADKLLALIIDNPFATDGEIEDITLHTQRPVDKKSRYPFASMGLIRPPNAR
jgi:hypothetical protein